MIAYKITNWAKYYENNRTRELKKMAWVPMPNKFDGDGYTYLVDHVNGAAHFGAWCALVEVASRCDVRGTLLRNGGLPHDSESLSRITRLPVKLWNDVLPRLISIGWIEKYIIPQEGAGLPQEDATTPHPSANERNGTERNGKNGKNNTLSGGKMPPDGEAAAFIQKQEQEEKRTPVKEIVDYLNTRCKTNYNPKTDYTQRLIKARWNEGYRFDDFKAVIDTKASQWLTDPKMIRYLRPATLFASSKFDGYLNEARQKTATIKQICPTCGAREGLHLESCPVLKRKIAMDNDEDIPF
jgi:uncharacterized phage protein (TIGR02220 family)